MFVIGLTYFKALHFGGLLEQSALSYAVNLWSAPILMAGIVLQHNYIEQHTTTEKIPSELAGLKLEAGQNRWLGMIRLACNN